MLNGGSGIDRAAYWSATAGIVADLANSGSNTGDASGDTYTSVEDLQGSRFDDKLSGDEGANWLFGGSGSDEIFGREGADTINGGMGADFLVGGGGADLFIFKDSSTSDTVLDFEVGIDRLDVSVWGASNFEDIYIASTHNGTAYTLALTINGTENALFLKDLSSTSFAALSADDFIFA